MTEPAFERVEELFHAAVAQPLARRAAFLAAACGGDAALRAAVDELLRFDDAPTQPDGFLVSPVGRAADRLRHDPSTADAARPAAGPPYPSVPGYEILGVLGSGGMGVVYKARQVNLDRVVALKMLATPGAATAVQLDRFRAEAVILARLRLPNILPIYDVGESEGRPYFTMEYVDGPSLAQRLDGRPQDVGASARLVEELARTMHAVHEHGIVHRDLKPGNVLLSGVGSRESGVTEADSPTPDSCPLTPKITDFGVAKDWTADRNLTLTGVAVGTPRYMAPEQAGSRFGPVGPAADTYALGSILYELLTGRTPFDAGTPGETIARLLEDEPLSPRTLRPGLPRDLVTICLKCLEKSPARRYATALELADDLGRFRAGEPIRARPAGPVERAVRWCRRRPLVAGLAALSGLLTVALIATGLALYSRLRADLARADEQIVRLNVNIGVIELDSGDNYAAALRFAEALRRDRGSPEREREYRARVTEALRGGPRLDRVQSFDGTIVCAGRTPSGVRVAVVTEDGTLTVRDAFSGEPVGKPIGLGRVPLGGAFSADGRWLAVFGPDGRATVCDLATGASHDLPAQTESPATRVAFHPDAPALMVQHADSRIRQWDPTVVPPAAVGPGHAGGPDDPKEAPPGVGPGPVSRSLSEDARWVIFQEAGGTFRLVDFLAKRGTVTLTPGPGTGSLAVSADGRRVALVGPGDIVRVWDVGTGRWLGEPMRTQPAVSRVAFSPDGTRLLLGDAAGGARVWDAATGRPVTPRLRHHGPLAAAAFHADGRQLVAVDRSGLVRLWNPDREEPVPSSVEELVALAEVLAGGRIDDTQGVRPFDAAQCRAAWDRLTALRVK